MPYVDGVFYELDKVNMTATACKLAKTNKNAQIIIPNTINHCKVTRIANNAFAEAKHLEKIVLADTVVEIGKRAFMSCKNLKTVSIGARRISVGECAFSHCENLKEFTTNNRSTTVIPTGYGAFGKCYAIQFFNIDFGGTIHCETFNYCSNLKELHLAHGVSLKTECIKNCPNLTHVYVDGELKASNPIRKKLKRLTLVCNELSSILDWAYEGYKIIYEDDFLPF